MVIFLRGFKSMRYQCKLHLLVLGDENYDDNLLRRYLGQDSDSVQLSVSNGHFDGQLAAYGSPDIVLLSFFGRPTDTKVVSYVRNAFEGSVLVVLAENASALEIIEGVRAGAQEFLLRTPQTIKFLEQKILRAYQLSSIRKSQAEKRSLALTDSPYVGETIERIRKAIPNVIQSAINTIYIEGETGTGKEVVVELFREAAGPLVPFISVNCGAITPSLMESEFFGHIKGSFTGASNNKTGFLEKASGGYLFLDEVANLTKEAQAALLRAIENQEVIPIGETKARPISVRFLAATNESIQKLVASGKFRQDLWQRLSEKTISLPPLRARRGEIPALIKSIAQNMAGGPYQVSTAAIEVLSSASWRSGNIRQLRNCLRAATEFQVDKTIGVSSIPASVLAEVTAEQKNALNEPFDMPYPSGQQPESAGYDKNCLTLQWQDDATPSFDDLTDQLLIKMIKAKTKGHDKISLRKLAASMGMVRNTLSNRMKVLSRKNMLVEPEMLKLIGES